MWSWFIYAIIIKILFSRSNFVSTKIFWIFSEIFLIHFPHKNRKLHLSTVNWFNHEGNVQIPFKFSRPWILADFHWVPPGFLSPPGKDSACPGGWVDFPQVLPQVDFSQQVGLPPYYTASVLYFSTVLLLLLPPCLYSFPFHFYFHNELYLIFSLCHALFYSLLLSMTQMRTAQLLRMYVITSQ